MTDYSAPVPSKRRKGGQPGTKTLSSTAGTAPASKRSGLSDGKPPGSRTGEIEGVVPLLSAGRLRRHH